MHVNPSYLETFLDNVEIVMSIGITEAERAENGAQHVLVSAHMFEEKAKFNDTDITTCLDYHRVYQYLMTWENRPHTDLIETLAEELTAFIFEDSRVDACHVKVKKPDIYKNAACSGVAIYRTRKDHEKQ